MHNQVSAAHTQDTLLDLCGDKVSGLVRISYLRLSSQHYSAPMDSDCVAVQPVKENSWILGFFSLFRHLFLPHSPSLPCFPLPFYPFTSNRTLMGPYGVDRAVHSMEFTDCENGLGKSFLTSVPTSNTPQHSTILLCACRGHMCCCL